MIEAGRPRFSFQLQGMGAALWDGCYWKWQPRSHPSLPCDRLHGFLPPRSLADLFRQGTCPSGMPFHSCKMGIIHPFLKNAMQTVSMNLRTGVEIIVIAALLASTCFVTVSQAMITS